MPDGELATLVAAADWSAGPLGDPQDLAAEPAHRREHLPLLALPHPAVVGPELRMVYNDAYRPMLGSKHPRAFGAPGHEVWPEIWHVIGPMLHQVVTGGGATWSNDQLLVLDRNGFPEECYFTYSYSPIVDPGGDVAGVFCAVTETTDRVLGERRLRTLAAMARLVGSDSRDTWSSGPRPCSRATSATTRSRSSRTSTRRDHGRRWPRCSRSGCPPSSRAPGRGWPTCSGRPRARGGSTGPERTEPTRSPGHLRGVACAPRRRTVGCRAHRPPGRAAPRRVLDSGPGTTACGPTSRLCATHVAGALAGVGRLDEERRRTEALAALDQAKSEFFTTVSHELRTPLTLISGPAQDALAAESRPEQRRRLELVERHTQRLTRVVDALLDFGRMESGRMEPDAVPVDLAQVTRGLAEGFRPAAERAGLMFAVRCEDLPGPVVVDKEMYERVVLNLLSNALKYTPDGSVRVTLRAREERVEVAVRDTGVGIARDNVDRAFERFERLPVRPGARSREGAGIGLALVRAHPPDGRDRHRDEPAGARQHLHGDAARRGAARGAVARIPSRTPEAVDDVLREVDEWVTLRRSTRRPRTTGPRPCVRGSSSPRTTRTCAGTSATSSARTTTSSTWRTDSRPSRPCDGVLPTSSSPTS